MAHSFRRTVLVAVAVLVAALSCAMPAAAGGPTSVLLSAADLEKVVAVGYSDQAYVELQELIPSVDTASTATPPSAALESGRMVRAAWLIHDQSVWRLDSIYLDAPGGPWIATIQSLEGQPTGEPVWSRSTNPTKLRNLLTRLGFLGNQSSPAASTPGASAPPASAPAGDGSATPPAAASPNRTVPAGTSALTGWRWALPGFALGLIVAVVAVRLVPRHRQWELVDAE